MPLLLHEQLQRETLALRAQVHALHAQLQDDAASPQRWSQSPPVPRGRGAEPRSAASPAPGRHPQPDLTPSPQAASPQPGPGSWRAMLRRGSPTTTQPQPAASPAEPSPAVPSKERAPTAAASAATSSATSSSAAAKPSLSPIPLRKVGLG